MRKYHLMSLKITTSIYNAMQNFDALVDLSGKTLKE